MHYLILSTKDLSKGFFLHARVLMQTPEATELKKKTISKLYYAFCVCPNFTSYYILHLDQKAAKCKTCKWLYSKFYN